MALVWRGKWKEKALLLLVVCVLVPTFAAQQPNCPTGEYRPEDDYGEESDFCCRSCHPGEKLVKHCEGDNLRTQCEPCGPDTYQDQINYARNCRSCTRCGDHETMVSDCSKTTDRVCQCEADYYLIQHDSSTRECLECTTCGPGEEVRISCTPRTDTVCVCQKSFFRSNDECLPCTSCTDACRSFCGPEDGDTIYVLYVLSACFVVLFVVAIIITNRVTKRCGKKKMLIRMESSSTSTTSTSQDGDKYREKLIYDVESPNTELYKPVFRPVVPVFPVCESPSELPDCVPREIKIDQLIYSVLEKVPVRYVKQLVRSLGVSEREIERAQEDHRTTKEAHYQMFLVWAEGRARGGAGGAREVLPRPLLQDLLEKLRVLDLDGIAEELEVTYDAQSAE